MTDQSHLLGGSVSYLSAMATWVWHSGDSHACLPILGHFEHWFTSDVESASDTIIK